MPPEFIDYDAGNASLDWLALAAAIEDGHRLPKAQLEATYLHRGDDTVISLCAWIDGLGIAIKTPTIFPGNVGGTVPSVNGGFSLYSDKDGTLLAFIDFHLITKWKTAADSLLASMKLARTGSKNVLIVGAGTVARSMVEAYRAGFPNSEISVWNRTPENAERLVSDYPETRPVDDLEAAVRGADIVCCATMSSTPVVRGSWLRPGQHIDLIGSYLPDMREFDDEAIRRARVFVDSRAMTMETSGDVVMPLASGAITPDDIVADFYDLAAGKFARMSDGEITLFKNGGGAHLDLMAAAYIREAWRRMHPQST